MGYLGYKPADKPLTAADITDSIITSAKIVDATITNSDVASSIITGQTTETSIAGGDSVLIYDDSASALRKMTRTNFVAGVGGTNTPAFQAYPSTTQSISETTFTKVTYGTETFDSDSNFASSTFTPTTAGKYFVYSNLAVYASATSAMSICWNQIRKNGSGVHHLALDNRGSNTYYASFNVSAIVDMNGTTDYLEIYTYVDSTNNNGGTVDTHSTFGAYKLIGV
jgi:hypothetical protein